MRLLVLWLFCVILTTACKNTTTTEQNDATALETRSLSTDDHRVEEVEAEDLGMGYIARKWELGSEYIDFQQEGTFEAVLDNKHIEGRWGLSYGTEDKRTLKLFGKEVGSDGHTHNFNKSFEIIDLSYDRLVVIDGEGNKINLFPE